MFIVTLMFLAVPAAWAVGILAMGAIESQWGGA